jgi:hypothetical protein
MVDRYKFVPYHGKVVEVCRGQKLHFWNQSKEEFLYFTNSFISPIFVSWEVEWNERCRRYGIRYGKSIEVMNIGKDHIFVLQNSMNEARLVVIRDLEHGLWWPPRCFAELGPQGAAAQPSETEDAPEDADEREEESGKSNDVDFFFSNKTWVRPY